MSTHLQHHAVDGYVEEIPDPRWGIASFTLIHPPQLRGPAGTRQPGHRVRVHHERPARHRGPHPGRAAGRPGTRRRHHRRAQRPRRPVHLTVTALRVLQPAPTPPVMTLDRYGDYAVVFDAGIDTVPVFTAGGQWVGTAPDPDGVAALIARHDHRTR